MNMMEVKALTLALNVRVLHYGLPVSSVTVACSKHNPRPLRMCTMDCSSDTEKCDLFSHCW